MLLQGRPEEESSTIFTIMLVTLHQLDIPMKVIYTSVYKKLPEGCWYETCTAQLGRRQTRLASSYRALSVLRRSIDGTDNEVLGEKTVPVPLCPLQNQQRLAGD